MLKLVVLLIYQASLFLMIIIALPVILLEMALSGRWRRYLPMRLGFVPGSDESPVVIYAPSVGEANTGVRLIRVLEEEPLWKNCLFIGASMTPEGRKIFEENGVKGVVFPLDFFPFVVSWLSRVKPRSIIIIEGEMWPCFLYTCKRKRIPIYVVAGRAGRMRKALKRLIRLILLPGRDAVKLVLVQSDRHINYYRHILSYSTPIKVGGTLKLREIPGGESNEKIFDVAWVSFHPGEEKYFYQAYKHVRGYHLFAPRKLDMVDEVKAHLEGMGVRCLLYSEKGLNREREGVLILDTLGELGKLIHLAKVAVIGGSFVKKGAHNVYEPLACGVPVITGPYFWNYKEEVSAAVKNGCGLVAHSPHELIRHLDKFLNEQEVAFDSSFIRLFDGLKSTVQELNEYFRKDV